MDDIDYDISNILWGTNYMNDIKVAFIICWKDLLFMQECVNYIKRLILPENCIVDIITISGAESIFEAYNAAMKDSDADYKIYIRENVFIYKKSFISDVLCLFDKYSQFKMIGLSFGAENNFEIKNVSCIDGSLIMTRDDVEWREDLFNGYSLYSESQCMEFQRRGMSIGAIPYSQKSLIIARKPEWPDMHLGENVRTFSKNYYSLNDKDKDYEQKLIDRVKEICNVELSTVEEFLNSGKVTEGINRLMHLSKARVYDELIDELITFAEIQELEKKEKIDSFSDEKNVDEIRARIKEIKFLGYRILANIGVDQFLLEYNKRKISLEALAYAFVNDDLNRDSIFSEVKMLLKERYSDELKWLGICSLLYRTDSSFEKKLKDYQLTEKTNQKDRQHVRSVFYNRYYKDRGDLDWFKGKCAVYTCITGKYDKLSEPGIVNPEWDYYCFTDDPTLSSDVWKMVYLEAANPQEPILLARKVKILPMEYLKEYDYTIWVDGNMTIRGDLKTYIKTYSRECSMICFPHHRRETIRQEANALIYNKKGNEEILKKQILKYEKAGFPDDMGLCETGMLVRSNHDPLLTKVMYQWFDEIKSESRRDQLSLGYVCWKNNYRYDICDLVITDNEFVCLNGHLSVPQ